MRASRRSKDPLLRGTGEGIGDLLTAAVDRATEPSPIGVGAVPSPIPAQKRFPGANSNPRRRVTIVQGVGAAQPPNPNGRSSLGRSLCGRSHAVGSEGIGNAGMGLVAASTDRSGPRTHRGHPASGACSPVHWRVPRRTRRPRTVLSWRGESVPEPRCTPHRVLRPNMRAASAHVLYNQLFTLRMGCQPALTRGRISPLRLAGEGQRVRGQWISKSQSPSPGDFVATLSRGAREGSFGCGRRAR